MSEHPGDPYATHFAAEKLEQDVNSVLIAYRLTLSGGQPVQYTPWHRDSSMDPYSVRVLTGDDEITLSVTDWDGSEEEVRPFLANGSASASISSARNWSPAPAAATRTGPMPGAEHAHGDDALGAGNTGDDDVFTNTTK